jgi:hypothetical protein
MAPQQRRCIVTAKQSVVKRYVVKLSDEERERLDALIHIGTHPARLLTKARILLKADTIAASLAAFMVLRQPEQARVAVLVPLTGRAAGADGNGGAHWRIGGTPDRFNHCA